VAALHSAQSSFGPAISVTSFRTHEIDPSQSNDRRRRRSDAKERMLRCTLNVRFGSTADICGAISHVRFTPNCDCKSGYLRFVMSALPPKADMCSVAVHIRFGPKADIPSKPLCCRSVALKTTPSLFFPSHVSVVREPSLTPTARRRRVPVAAACDPLPCKIAGAGHQLRERKRRECHLRLAGGLNAQPDEIG
jgi:hypothetical protein